MGTRIGLGSKRLRSWLVGALVLVAVCVGIGPLVGPMIVDRVLLGPSAEESARNQILREDAPAAVRYIGTANLDPADPGPEAEKLLTRYFSGDDVLASSSVPGPVTPDGTAATVDVRMVRTAEGGAWSRGGSSEATVTICLRFTVGWVYGAEATFREIDCP